MSDTRKQWELNEINVKKTLAEIENSFAEGRKSSLVNPILAHDYDHSADGRYQPVIEDKDRIFINACAKIAAFLMDKDAVNKQLYRLNKLIEERSKAKNDNSVHILREILEEELHQFGFKEKFGKTFDNLRPEVFRATLANGLLLKDAVLGNQSHGEFTHPIQWLVIAWQEKEFPFLGMPVIDIFKQLGEEKSVFYRDAYRLSRRDNTEIPREEKSIWDLIVDRFDTKDFRSPSILHQYLLTTENSELKTLKTLLTKRRQKRIDDFDQEILKKKYAQHKNSSSFYHKNSKLVNLLEPKITDEDQIDFEAFKQKNP